MNKKDSHVVFEEQTEKEELAWGETAALVHHQYKQLAAYGLTSEADSPTSTCVCARLCISAKIGKVNQKGYRLI